GEVRLDVRGDRRADGGVEQQRRTGAHEQVDTIDPVPQRRLYPVNSVSDFHPGSVLSSRRYQPANPMTSTALRSSPSPVVAMITSSPARRVKSGGGTIAVPVSRTTPTGKSSARKSPPTRPSGRPGRAGPPSRTP